jgi:predicted nucleotidyltransferase
MMNKEKKCNELKLDVETERQIEQCLNLLKEILGKDLLGVYLYGSSVFGGLQKYSDLDLFVVSSRSTTHEEKTQLVTKLLLISGVYMKSTKLPIEMTIVEKAEVNPWRYPPHFDFQYGDWLREQFESGIIEPWPTKEMPDLALLIMQVLLARKTLLGADPDQLLCKIPYNDFMMARTDALQDLMPELNSDTRNVLLTLARIWSTVWTDAIRSKPAAAGWAIDRLPEQYCPVMKRAMSICKGEEKESWDDIQELIKPCADFIIGQINHKMTEINLSHNTNKAIKLAEYTPVL